ELARRFGKKPLAQLVSPAEQIALRGFQVNVQFVHLAEHRLDCLAADPEAARIFLRKGEDGEYEPKQPGDKLIQPDLARTLHAIEREQPRAGGYRPERFLHAMIETEKRLYAVRQRLGDPAFNPGVEDRVREMIGKDFASDLWRQIGEQATPAVELVVHPEHG